MPNELIQAARIEKSHKTKLDQKDHAAKGLASKLSEYLRWFAGAAQQAPQSLSVDSGADSAPPAAAAASASASDARAAQAARAARAAPGAAKPTAPTATAQPQPEKPKEPAPAVQSSAPPPPPPPPAKKAAPPPAKKAAPPPPPAAKATQPATSKTSGRDAGAFLDQIRDGDFKLRKTQTEPTQNAKTSSELETQLANAHIAAALANRRKGVDGNNDDGTDWDTLTETESAQLAAEFEKIMAATHDPAQKGSQEDSDAAGLTHSFFGATKARARRRKLTQPGSGSRRPFI
jgi:hypothetical protein